jgi:hypothetical protein
MSQFALDENDILAVPVYVIAWLWFYACVSVAVMYAPTIYSRLCKPAPLLSSFIGLITLYTPVQETLLAHLDISDIISLSRSSKAFQDFVQLAERTRFNFNKRLKPFITSPKVFRSLQARQNIIICGTFAYESMARLPLGNLGYRHQLECILVEKGDHVAALIAFLEQDGYTVDGQPILGALSTVIYTLYASVSRFVLTYGQDSRDEASAFRRARATHYHWAHGSHPTESCTLVSDNLFHQFRYLELRLFRLPLPHLRQEARVPAMPHRYIRKCSTLAKCGSDRLASVTHDTRGRNKDGTPVNFEKELAW